MFRRRCLRITSLSLVLGSSALGVDPTFVLTPNTPASGYGSAADVDGDYIVVGYPYDNDVGPNAGAAYIFHREGAIWVEQAKLYPSAPRLIGTFGYSVAIDGDRVIIGAPNYDPTGLQLGDAYVFHRIGTTWALESRLTFTGSSQPNLFGWSSDISGDVVVVARASLRVHVFRRSGSSWAEEAVLDNPEFRGVVSLLDDRIAVGASLEGGSGGGAVYIFRSSGTSWIQETKLVGTAFGAGGQFGAALTLDGARLLVGAPNDSSVLSNAGSAHVFVRSGSIWRHERTLRTIDAEAGDGFGYSVALSSPW